jgi:hypothetical protein
MILISWVKRKLRGVAFRIVIAELKDRIVEALRRVLHRLLCKK